jgi:hypothetical protein
VPLLSETVLIDVPGTQLITVSDGARFAGKLSAFDSFLLSGGSLDLGGTSVFNAALTVTGGVLQGPGSITANGAFNWSGGALAGSGQFTTSATSVATLAPLARDLELNRNWVNQGSVSWQGANHQDLEIGKGASLLNASGGVFTLAAADGSSIKGDGAFRNDGTLNKNGPGKTTIKAAFGNNAGGTVNVNSGELKLKNSPLNAGSINVADGATLRLTHDLLNFGRISGSGTLEADTVFNFGVVAPGANGGAGVGTFTVLGDYYQATTGVLEMGLGGVLAGQYDVLAITGKALLSGTLATAAVNGYAPKAGDSFKLMTYKSRSGEFGRLVAPPSLAVDADYMKRFGLFTLD